MNDIKLNVGPSPIWKKEDWVTLDHKPSRVDQKTILGDADNIPLENESCKTIFCSHVIEHIPNYKFEKVLLEFNRVLKKDGILRILSPDLFLLAKAYVKKDKIFYEKLLNEDENIRKDLGYGGTFMNCIVSPGQDTVIFNNSLTEFIGGVGHIYLYDFEMLKTLLERYGFYEIKQKKFCESELKDYEEPLHVEGTKPEWQDLNKKFFEKHNLINQYNSKKKMYETNFVLTGFDRDPVTSLIVEAKKEENIDSLNIKDLRNYNYGRSLLDDKIFQNKYDSMKKMINGIK
ncbi:MAG: class I SAM-dependent methyltransferase [Nitrosopumilus sp.]|nr:class I SAM-dependent methyltransferase [Nitrosopumilus sp.]